MPKKILKDIFFKEKNEEIPLNEELKMEDAKKSRFFFKFLVGALILILIGGFGFVILGRISTATINIVSRHKSLNIDSRLKVSVNPAANGLSFEIAQLDADESQQIVPTGTAAGGQRASGKITIYNNYSNAPQKLIATTRFETSDGKIYRIKDAVSAPGMGTVDAIVYADNAGDEYNIGLVDFTVPGLKTSPKFRKVFAKSKTPMTGGASGNVKAVKKEDIESARKALGDKIKNRLYQTMLKQKPNDYLLYKGAVKMEFVEGADNPQVGDSPAKSMIFKMKGIATGFLFKKTALSKALTDINANDLNKSQDNETVFADNLESLDLNLVFADPQNKEITVNLKGVVKFVWAVDENKLLDELANYRGKDYNSVLQKYPAIEKASITLTPFFWRKLPTDKNKIKINIETSKDAATPSGK